ncbi:hypothetical protein [Microcystis phage MaeS]|nr:hypothetical protein [Microcystis phage MaeS]
MEERKLINGELLTLDETIEKNNKLIWHSCGKYANRALQNGLEMGDLYGLAGIGMVKAFRKFDPENFDVKFATYAVPMMQGEIQRFFRDHLSSVKFSRSTMDLAFAIFKEKMGDESVEDIMLHFDATEKAVKRALEYIRGNVKSLNETIYENDGDPITMGDMLTNGSDGLSDYTSINVNEFMESLEPRIRTIVEMLLEGKKQQEIADAIGCSQVQVSRLIKKELYDYAETFFGYPLGYFQDRPYISKVREEEKMNKNKEKDKDTIKRTSIEQMDRMKELLRTTDMNTYQIAKETGVNKGSVHYWAKKIRNPQAEENPVTISYITPKPKDQPIEASENTFYEAMGVSPELFEKEDFHVEVEPDRVAVGERVVERSQEFVVASESPWASSNLLETGYTYSQAEEEARIAEEKAEQALAESLKAEKDREELLSKSHQEFEYVIRSEDVTTSEMHTLFTQVGQAASNAGVKKFNVLVAATTKEFN